MKVSLLSLNKVWKGLPCAFPVHKYYSKQESIPVGCVPPTWKPYMLQVQWPPPDVVLGGGGPGMNKFEQVSSDHH